MQDARAKELSFFRASPHYNGLKNVGTGFLSVKLSNHLISSIRKQLPVITHSINEGIINLEKGARVHGRGPGAALGLVRLLKICSRGPRLQASVKASCCKQQVCWEVVCLCWGAA